MAHGTCTGALHQTIDDLRLDCLEPLVVDFADAHVQEEQDRSMVREGRLSPIVVVDVDLVAVLPLSARGLEVMLIARHIAFVHREKDAICVARRALLLTRVVFFAVLVVLEGWQERDLLFMEPIKQFISGFGH